MLEPIGDDLLETAATLLERGFPARSRAAWLEVFARQDRLGGNAEAGIPRGYVLRHEAGVIGVIVTPASVRHRPDGTRRVVVNLSSWFMDPDHRWRAPMMLRAVVRAHDALYTDLTPSEDVARMLGLLGFETMSVGTAIHALPISALRRSGGARVDAYGEGAAALPDRAAGTLLESHRRAGCLVAVLRADGRAVPLVFVRGRLRGLPVASLAFCDDHRILGRCLGAVARWLIPRGVFALLTVHRPEEALSGHWRSPGGACWARGADARAFFTNRTDHAYSEKCLLQH